MEGASDVCIKTRGFSGVPPYGFIPTLRFGTATGCSWHRGFKN